MTLELPETFLYEKRGRIAVMTINRPRAMNAFTGEMLAAMDACFEDFRKDDELWVAILTGAGDKAFSWSSSSRTASVHSSRCACRCW